MGLKLFEDGGGSDSDCSSDDLSKIEINEEFARRYEHNKKREDLQRLEELKKKGVISDTDSEEDNESSEEEEDLVNYSSKQDLKFFDALIKVRNKDPSLKNKDAELFDSDNEDNDEEGADGNSNNKEKKKKPMYLKDVTAKHLIEEGPEFEDEDDEEGNKNNNKKKSYVEEQELLRKEFLDAVVDEDNEGDFLKVKNDKKGDEDEDDYERVYEKKLDEYFQEDDKLDEKEKFLKDYFRKRMWSDKENGGNKGLNDDGLDVSDDEEELKRQEDYEIEFNFRFEENAGDRVPVFPRNVDGSVRKKDNARKVQRKSKEERMAQAEVERKEELKRLKNLKKKEMNEKLKKIRETAGILEDEDCLLDLHDLEEEFDPEEHDRTMKKTFDDKFYEAEDVDPEFGSDEEDGELKKPNFEEEDELLGLPKGWDDQENCDGFLAIRQRTLKLKVENAVDEEEEETVLKEGKKKRKRKASKLEEEVIKKELEEYYKLDYEDTIGDLKTRFKYRPVNKNTYGLNPKEILVVDDKELNQLVPLKKLATYREDEFVVPRRKIKEQKERIKSLLKGEMSNGANNALKRSKQVGDTEPEKPQAEAQNKDQKELSRKQRRKKRLRELKLTPSRLAAYKNFTAKSNKKRKHKA